MNFIKHKYIIILLLLISYANPIFPQLNDTISNWDNITANWTIFAAVCQVVENPETQGINPSSYCLQITTSSNPYDLIFTDFTSPVNFNEFPFYRLKILAPASGGQVVLKFQNYENTSWQEIIKTPTPGQWDDLEFDFSGTSSDDYNRMVIFFDFMGTTAGNQWYIDDVIKSSVTADYLVSNLPIIVINTDGIEIPDEPKISGQMGIIDNGPGNMNSQYDPFNNYDGMIGIEVRGQSSQMFPKKAYGFETRDDQGGNLNVPLLGMPEENDWILYAPYSDKSMLRNVMSFYMGSKLDPYCTRTVYCELIVNNDYKGVYVLMEKIKKDENRVNIATLKPEDISGDELTGGYIVKVDKIDPDFVYGIDGWLSVPSPPYPDAKNITFQYYYPKADDIMPQQSSYIIDYITSTENSLTKPYFSDPNIGYNKFLNTGSFIDQMILCEVSKEVDKYRYSTFFYKEKYSDGGKLFAGPAWDFNLGYSNVDYWPPGNDYWGWLYTMVEPVDWSIMFWWKRLMEDQYFEDLLKTRWYNLRQNELSNDKLAFVIDSITNYIDEAQQRNYERWPVLGQYVWPNFNWMGNDYDDEVEFFETWLFNRMAWMDYNMPGSMLYPAAELSGNASELTITLTDDYFSRPILKKKYFTLNNAPQDLTIDTVIYQNASQATIIFSGNANGSSEISLTLKEKILNSFEDLTSSSIILGTGFISDKKPEVNIFSTQNTICIKCNSPELLGNEMEIFNISGQLLTTVKIEKKSLNRFTLNIPPGYYLCRYVFEEIKQTVQIIFF